VSLRSDPALEQAALVTVRELMAAGLAGLDAGDDQLFAVDAPAEQRDLAEVALDHLGASFLRDGAYGVQLQILMCLLPRWVRAELELDEPGAPRLQLPVTAGLFGQPFVPSATSADSVPSASRL
jgi:hypothetical protein